MAETIARLERVTFAYPGGAPVFSEFSWAMHAGDSWAVIGPSGCGKTTLLYLLAGLRTARSGTVEVGGSVVRGPRLDIGLILQDYGLLPWATARENVQLGLRVRGTGRRERAEVAHSWLARLGLAGLADRYPSQLSGGQRQRVAIARTLALQPTLLLMDEPFSSLDSLTRETLQALALELGIARGLSTVLVTHDIQEAVYLGQRILVLGRPGEQPAHIENPAAGDPEYRARTEFARVAQDVRQQIRTSAGAQV